MPVYSRSELKEYCLRNLGKPVLEINVDDSQLEDRIDEALGYWNLYHPEGIEKTYLKQQIKASVITLINPVAETFSIGSVITGSTSGATAIVTKQIDKSSSGTELLVYKVDGRFIAGETISNGTVSDILSSYKLNEYDNKFIPLNDYIFGISKMVSLTGTSSSSDMFNLEYQIRLNDLFDLSSTSILDYSITMSHLTLLDQELNKRPRFRFNRLQRKVFPEINWDNDIRLGEYLVFECYRALDPETYEEVWNEPWLKQYTTALIKKQWGQNLSKFAGLQLPGGVTLDGDKIYTNAVEEIRLLEEDLITKQAPCEMFVG